MVKTGFATKSDALLAVVKAGEIETQLIEARGEAELAIKSLALLLGDDSKTTFTLPQVLPGASAVRAALDFTTTEANMELRSDVAAARAAARASAVDVTRALSLYLPRLNAIARYDWHSPDRLYGGDNNWTVGVMATWTPFAGASEIAERRAAGARAAEAKAGLEGARAQASLEIAKALIDEKVALSRLAISERSEQQSREAHRIVARKYQGGLATVVELLQAAAIETQSQLALSHARYAGITAAAEGLRVRGLDPAALADKLSSELLGAR
jgi:outer membrane protein TolC